MTSGSEVLGNLQDEDHIRWYSYFGNCAAIDSFLTNKSEKVYLLPKFLNALLRGISQCVFVNNPFSGILILAGLFWSSPTVGFAVLLATTIAILTALLLHQKSESVSAGLVLFNAVLLASVTSSLWTPLYKEPIGSIVWIFILVGSALSVFISSGLGNLLSSFRPNLPILSIPFHVLAFILFACLKPSGDATTDNMSHEGRHLNQRNESSFLILSTANLPNSTSMSFLREDFLMDDDYGSQTEFYSWRNVKNVIVGVILSSGAVFGASSIFCSILIYIAILLFSPLLTLMCFSGAVIGTIIGLLLTPFPNEDVFLGIWGFNGFLSCGAVGLFFVVNWFCLLTGTASAIFTTVLQLSLMSHFTSNRMPIFGLPFILSTLIFLCISTNGEQLVRVRDITFPERQRKEFMKERNRQTTSGIFDLCNPKNETDNEIRTSLLADERVLA